MLPIQANSSAKVPVNLVATLLSDSWEVQLHAVSLTRMGLQNQEIIFCFIPWGFTSVQGKNHHRNHAPLDASVLSDMPHPWSYEENELHDCWAKNIFWGTSQVNYSQPISPVMCFEVCFLILLKLLASLLLMLVMQWKPRHCTWALSYKKQETWGATGSKRRKETFWVQNLMFLSLSID